MNIHLRKFSKITNQVDAKEYWESMANYASMRGNAMFNRVSELLQNYPETRDELVASCDSAKSYFVDGSKGGVANFVGGISKKGIFIAKIPYFQVM